MEIAAYLQVWSAAGEVYNLGWKQGMMTRLRKGQFANDEILDYLQNKDNKALIFTNRHLIYISLKRQTVRWSFSLDNLSSVSHLRSVCLAETILDTCGP